MTKISKGQSDSHFPVPMPRFYHVLLVVCIFLLTIGGIPAKAQGNLLVTPKRVVLEGNKRSMDMNLSNTGGDTATYAISFVQIRMHEDGSFEQITEPDSGQKFAERFLRYFPRQVTLGPNESQTVKVQLLRSNELTAGEYRSHFYFRAIPKEKPLGEKDNEVLDSTSFSVRLTPIFGILIPAIIRIGESTMKVTVSDLAFKYQNDTIPLFTFNFNRSGNMSVYGDIAVDYVSADGKITRVGIANGVAVYTPNTIRRFQMYLIKTPGIDYKSGKLKVTFSAPSDVKPVKYSEAELILK